MLVCVTHVDAEGLDGAVQQLNQAKQVWLWHGCFHGNSASLSRQTPCPQFVTFRGPTDNHKNTVNENTSHVLTQHGEQHIYVLDETPGRCE